jgi:hypothetical protein
VLIKRLIVPVTDAHSGRGYRLAKRIGVKKPRARPEPTHRSKKNRKLAWTGQGLNAKVDAGGGEGAGAQTACLPHQRPEMKTFPHGVGIFRSKEDLHVLRDKARLAAGSRWAIEGSQGEWRFWFKDKHAAIKFVLMTGHNLIS